MINGVRTVLTNGRKGKHIVAAMGSASRTAQITRSDFHGKGVGAASWTMSKNQKVVERRCGIKKIGLYYSGYKKPSTLTP